MLALALALLALAACGAPPTVTPTPAASASPVAVATAVPPTAIAPHTPSPTPTDTPPPTATPAPRLWQLTTGGCCAQPYWSRDGSQVRFIDKPDTDAPSGIWGVDAGTPGGTAQFVTDRLGIYSPDDSLVAYPEAGQTYIERLSTGERWVVPSGGRAISFSPDGQLILWQANSSDTNFDTRVTAVWIANVDGTGAHQAARLTGGGVSDWFPAPAGGASGGPGQASDWRLLVTGRDAPEADPYLAVLDLADGALTRIVQVPRLRGTSLSPEGGWLAYQVAFSGDAAADGLWVVRTDGTPGTTGGQAGAPRRLDVYGPYRWRAEGRLLLVPLDTTTPVHRLVEVDAATGEARALTDPAVTPFRIANGYWSLAPGGQRIAFVSAEDRNVWVLEVP